MKRILCLASGFMLGLAIARFMRGEIVFGCVLFAIAVVNLILSLRKE